MICHSLVKLLWHKRRRQNIGTPDCFISYINNASEVLVEIKVSLIIKWIIYNVRLHPKTMFISYTKKIHPQTSIWIHALIIVCGISSVKWGPDTWILFTKYLVTCWNWIYANLCGCVFSHGWNKHRLIQVYYKHILFMCSLTLLLC